MKRGVVGAVLALVAASAAGYALGSTTGVTLTSEGPVPETVSVNWGDTVVYSNADGIEHTVTIPRAEVSSPAIPPGGTFQQVFDGKGGNYNFVQRGTRNFSGQVKVRVDGSVTLNPGDIVVPYGKRVTFSGRSSFPSSAVVVRGRAAGERGAWATVLALTAGADGAYSGRVVPKVGTRYQARVAADQIGSRMVDVVVRPRITIAVSPRVVRTGTSILVTGRITPARAADQADLLAYDTRQKRWAQILTQPIPASGKVVFRPTVEEGRSRLRISVRRRATSAGFIPAESKWIRVLVTK